MRVSIVLGLTFGDEGKGVTTQWLCKQALKYDRKPVVIRFNGGAQAAHTINLDDEEHICSTYGSGVLLGVPTFLDKDFYFDPVSAWNEYLTLREKEPVLTVHPDCRVVTPYDVIAGVNNEKVLQDGSCGKGIFQTFKRYQSTEFNSILSHKGQEDQVRMFLDQARNYYQIEKNGELEDLFVKSIMELPFSLALEPPMGNDTELVYEGAQGLLLDMDYGFYPHVTPSHTGLDNIPPKHLQDADVYLVTRTYTTRHGNGYEPKHQLYWDLSDKEETNVDNEFQGPFKTGMLEFGLIHRAIDRHHLDVWQKKHNLQYHLMVTHGELALEHGYFDYLLKDGIWGNVEVCDSRNIKNVFINSLERSPIKVQSIRINGSKYSEFNL